MSYTICLHAYGVVEHERAGNVKVKVSDLQERLVQKMIAELV